jgi:hypothetical protein
VQGGAFPDAGVSLDGAPGDEGANLKFKKHKFKLALRISFKYFPPFFRLVEKYFENNKDIEGDKDENNFKFRALP